MACLLSCQQPQSIRAGLDASVEAAAPKLVDRDPIRWDAAGGGLNGPRSQEEMLMAVTCANPDTSLVAPLVASLNRFGLDLYRRWPGGDESRAVAPASISLALLQLLVAARGPTAAQIERALHLSTPGLDWKRAVQALQCRSEGTSAWSVASRLFPDEGLRLDPTFVETSQRLLLLRTGHIVPKPFRTRPEQARTEINRWVQDSTYGLISEILPAKAVSAATAIVLANAFTLKSDWAQAFDPAATAKAAFHAPRGDRRVDMMKQTSFISYETRAGISIARLDFKDGRTAMTVLLPKGRSRDGGVHDVLREVFVSPRADLQPDVVTIALPRFALSAPHPVELTPVLRKLGIVLGDANLSGLGQIEGGVKLNAAYHSAVVRVDEHGVVSAAATALAGNRTGAGPTELTLDRPFDFVVHDKPTGLILLVGHYAGPADGE